MFASGAKQVNRFVIIVSAGPEGCVVGFFSFSLKPQAEVLVHVTLANSVHDPASHWWPVLKLSIGDDD